MGKLSSFTNNPKAGYFAHFRNGDWHTRAKVRSVSADGSWVLLSNGEPGETRALRDDQGRWFMEDSRYPVKFTRMPEVGDVAEFKDSTGPGTTTLMVSGVKDGGTLVLLTGGEKAVLRLWGAYCLKGTYRRVRFSPYAVEEIVDLLGPVHN